VNSIVSPGKLARPQSFVVRLAMPEASKQWGNKESRRLAAIDQMLLAAMQQGPTKKREAINRILELVPSWTRGDCWNRIRYLRKTLARNNSEGDRPHEAGTPRPRVSIRRSCKAPWTAADDDALFRLAGYEPVNKIAQRIGRSAQAVRYRMGALGMSARVTDGWSLRALRKLLRVGPSRLRYLVANGILRVRDARVTLRSLTAYCQKNTASLSAAALERTALAFASEEVAFSWERTADLLGATVAHVQEMIRSGQLKLMDWFVTDRSFEDFCKKHGSEINLALLDPATARWLRNEYGVTDVGMKTIVSRAQKHVLIIRTCVCGRTIAGNPYFRHIRVCGTGSSGANIERSNVLNFIN
jgi:hypothetical protein